MEHPELSPEDEQTKVAVFLWRDALRSLETLAAEYGIPRSWVLNIALMHLAECPHRGDSLTLKEG